MSNETCDEFEVVDIDSANRSFGIAVLVVVFLYVGITLPWYLHVYTWSTYIQRRHVLFLMLTLPSYAFPLTFVVREVLGRENVACVYLELFSFYVILFITAPMLIRVILFYFGVKRNRLIAQESYFESLYRMQGLPAEMMEEELHSRDKLYLNAMPTDIKGGKVPRRRVFRLPGPSHDIDWEERTTHSGPSSQFERLTWLSSTRFGLLVLMGAFFLDTLYVLSRDHSFYGCFGCEIAGATLIFLQTSASFLFVVGLVVLWLVRNEPDPYLISWEVRWALGLGIGFGLLFVILQIIDPYQLYARGKLTWGYVGILSWMSCYTISFPVQIYLAYKRARESTEIYMEVTLRDVLKSETGQELFKAHLMEEISYEHYLFLRKALLWKTTDQKKAGAMKIYDLHISQAGLLAINISSDCLENIRTKLENDEVEPTLFDQALSQVWRLLSSDSFGRFRRTDRFIQWQTSVAEI